MTKQDQIIKAINKLTPNAHFSVWGEELIWNDENIKQPSKSELETAMAEAVEEQKKIEYRRTREREYPSINDCVHALLDGGKTLEDLQKIRADIKKKYPKG
tara:strand:+ start:635 stop:937 length:303 start_codon:yes stop_codon:yes gene_type:complete